MPPFTTKIMDVFRDRKSTPPDPARLAQAYCEIYARCANLHKIKLLLSAYVSSLTAQDVTA
jgi:hypothetical protein